MTVTITHAFVSEIADDAADLAAGKICQQAHWNANHIVTNALDKTGDTMTGPLGVGVTPTYAKVETEADPLGAVAGNTTYPLSFQWHNGNNLTYFSLYGYRLSNGSSHLTEAAYFQYFPGGGSGAYLGFYNGSVALGAAGFDSLGISASGTVASDDGATYELEPHPSAVLEARSTTRGFLLPRLTTTQRDNIASPEPGLTIYNVDTEKLNFCDNGGTWRVVTST